MLHHAAMGIKNSINRAGQTIVEPFDKRQPSAMALKAGEFSLHHELAVHRSAPNHAAHRRIGIGLNYLPPRVRVNGPMRLKAMLVRGHDRHGNFELIDPPNAERDAAALATHQAISDRYRENYKIQVARHAERFAAANS
jgi:non-haem Fe2+, alpha-ketoglutarate-dependent halogenase